MPHETNLIWGGDFAGNPGGYPVNHNPYEEELAAEAERGYPVDQLVDRNGRRVSDPKVVRAYRNLAILHDALDLVIDLWPKPGYASVTLETHQWIKLRRVLLAIPDLVADDTYARGVADGQHSIQAQRPEHVCERCVHR